MIILNTTSSLLRVTTSAAVDIDCHVSWVDVTISSGATSPGMKNTKITTATTTTIDHTSSPASGVARTINACIIRNIHASSSNTITVLHTDGTTSVEIHECTLFAGEKIELSDAGTFRTYDSNGQLKIGGLAVDPSTNTFRLTGVSATPIMTADSTTLSTIFLAQYTGNAIALNDGTNWQLVQPPSEPSLAVSGRTTDLPFDVFAFLSAGTVTLEFLNWTNATTRATGIARTNGVWTKSGDITRRYLGSCRARSATTFHHVTNGVDLPCKFDLWNVDNRREHGCQLKASTNTWAYATATWRQAQASANYQIDVMVGVQEDYFEGTVMATSSTATTTISRQVGIGYDSTTAFTGFCGSSQNASTTVVEQLAVGRIKHQPTVGRHFYAWVEIGGTGVSFFGDNGALRCQSGISGAWEM